MSVTAIIIAGGVGARMGASIPKQFVEVGGKPVIVYTLEAFQRHVDVDSICVVCIEGWRGFLRESAEKHGITKLGRIVDGGRIGQESIRNGVLAVEPDLDADDIVVIHDGVRPMIDADVLTNVIEGCREHGNAVTSTPYNEQLFRVSPADPSTTTEFIPRETVRRVATPQAYRYGLLLSAYKRAFAEGIGIGPSDYTNTMMVQLGCTLHLAAGSDRNLKLTTPENLETFSAYLQMKGRSAQ